MRQQLSAYAGAPGLLGEPFAPDPLVLEAALGGYPSGLGDSSTPIRSKLLQPVAGGNGFHERRVRLDLMPRESLQLVPACSGKSADSSTTTSRPQGHGQGTHLGTPPTTIIFQQTFAARKTVSVCGIAILSDSSSL